MTTKNTANTDDDVWVSKTQKKKQMNDLQALGAELTKLSNHALNNIGLPEDLYQALLDYKKMTAHGAMKRQLQYIGRLMRDIDTAPIEDCLSTLKGENVAHNAYMQRLENLRTHLLENDQALTELITHHPHLDVMMLRTFIRNARKEKEANKPPKAFRALFQYLRQEISEHDDH